MHCRDKGTIKDSQYYFFSPPDDFRKYHYSMLVCGQLFCTNEYHIKRNGGHAPLFVLVNEGTFSLEYENVHYTANPDEAILIDGSKPHAYCSTNYCEFLFLHFAGNNSIELTNHLIAKNGSPKFKIKSCRQIRQLFTPILQRLYTTQHIQDIEFSPLIYEILCALQNESPAATAQFSPAVVKVIDYIRDHVAETLTLSLLAKQANLSHHYFAHLFRDEVGTSPLEYASIAKINLSLTMLKTTNKSISEIAELLHYSSASSYINAFVLRQGITPAKYRRQPGIF